MTFRRGCPPGNLAALALRAVGAGSRAASRRAMAPTDCAEGGVAVPSGGPASNAPGTSTTTTTAPAPGRGRTTTVTTSIDPRDDLSVAPSAGVADGLIDEPGDTVSLAPPSVEGEGRGGRAEWHRHCGRARSRGRAPPIRSLSHEEGWGRARSKGSHPGPASTRVAVFDARTSDSPEPSSRRRGSNRREVFRRRDGRDLTGRDLTGRDWSFQVLRRHTGDGRSATARDRRGDVPRRSGRPIAFRNRSLSSRAVAGSWGAPLPRRLPATVRGCHSQTIPFPKKYRYYIKENSRTQWDSHNQGTPLKLEGRSVHPRSSRARVMAASIGPIFPTCGGSPNPRRPSQIPGDESRRSLLDRAPSRHASREAHRPRHPPRRRTRPTYSGNFNIYNILIFICFQTKA